MKNQPGFIPDNISAISYGSIQRLPTQQHELTEYHPDSTDKLVSEILRGRADRLGKQKEAQQEMNEKIQDDMQKEPKVDQHQIKQSSKLIQSGMSRLVSSSKIKSELVNNIETKQLANDLRRQPQKEQNVCGDNGQFGQGTAEQKIAEMYAIQKINEIFVKDDHSIESGRAFVKKNQINEIKQIKDIDSNKQSGQNKIDNFLQGQFLHKNIYNEEHGLHLNSPNDSQQKSFSKFDLPKIDKIQNQSNDNQLEPHQKSLKYANSRASEPIADYLELGMGQSNNKMKSKSSNVQSQEHEKIYQAQTYKSPEGMYTVESKIEMKSSQISSPPSNVEEKRGYYEFSSKSKLKETDQQVVNALNDRLNQINQIEEAQMEAMSKRKSIQKNPSSSNVQVVSQMMQVGSSERRTHKENPYLASQFQTEQSDDLRDNRILQHHYQSNIKCLEKQTQELLQLYQALINNQQSKQLRRRVIDQEMENRRNKILLRNASYTKKFNFHSPIIKNNKHPLDFVKKFKVSPNLSEQFNEVKQKIEQQKLKQKQLQIQFDVVNKFQEMMRNKQISSYPQLPFDLEYDAELGRYTKVGLFKQISNDSPTKHKKYQFNKTKRTVEFDHEEIKYFDLLNYKKNMCRDVILQLEVFNLGRIKKLKDQNKLISMQIQFVNRQVEQANRQLQPQTFLKSKSPFRSPIQHFATNRGFAQSEYLIKTKTSFSRSPPIRTQHKISNFGSPLRPTSKQSNLKMSANKRISLRNSSSDRKLQLGNRKEANDRKKVTSPLAEIQDDYGLTSVHKQLNEDQQIPTFGKQQMPQIIMEGPIQNRKRQRIGSPLVKRKNYIKLNKEMLTRTETNITDSRQKIIIKATRTENSIPPEQRTVTEPSSSNQLSKFANRRHI